MPAVNNVGEPCAGEPHARFDGRGLETEHDFVSPRQPPTLHAALVHGRGGARSSGAGFASGVAGPPGRRIPTVGGCPPVDLASRPIRLSPGSILPPAWVTRIAGGCHTAIANGSAVPVVCKWNEGPRGFQPGRLEPSSSDDRWREPLTCQSARSPLELRQDSRSTRWRWPTRAEWQRASLRPDV